jgi:prefoldin subunit 5
MADSSTPLGIPKADFIEDIAAAAPTTDAVKKLFEDKQEILTKYRLLERHLIEKSQNLKRMRPDIAENLKAVRKLSSPTYQQPLVTYFQISDGLYGKARLKNDQTVSLWLGANLMVEHTFAEADELLTTKLDGIDKEIASIDANLVFLRDQIITTEVTVSRLTNHFVQLTKAEKK